MKKYILVMKSGYEHKVETDKNLLLNWENSINKVNGWYRLFSFENGTMVDLLEVAVIKPYRDTSDFPPPPPRPHGFEPRKESAY